MNRLNSLTCHRRSVLAAILVSLLAPPARAEYINLSWDDCGAAGVSNKTFACDTNVGAPFVLIGSFQPPPGLNRYLGFNGLISLTTSSATLPDWWKHGAGECRGTSGLSLIFDYSGATACSNLYSPGSTGGFAFDVGFGGVNKARLRVQGLLPNEVALNPGTEYYGFKFLVSRSNTVGAGACAGCNHDVGLVLDEIQLYKHPTAGYDPRITTPGLSAEVTWQPGGPSPTAPFVTNLIPAAGVPGTPLEVHGRNFLGTTSVRLGALAATFSVASDSVIQMTVPASARSGPVVVTSPAGTGSSATAFIVAPVIESFDPTSGPPFSTVSVHGYNFVGTTLVRIDGIPVSFVVSSEDLIQATVPVDADVGPIQVTNPGGTATSPLDFTRVDAGIINLAWDDCAGHGNLSKTFACDSNTGPPFPLFGSFIPPPGINEFIGVTAELTMGRAHPLPDWWKFGSGECRGASGLNVSMDFLSGPTSCIDFYQGQAQAGYLYQVGFGGPDRARCVIQGGVPFELRGPVDPSQEYYAFMARIARSKSTGAGSCSGCNMPASIVLNSIQLLQPGEGAYNPVLTVVGRGTVIWAGDLVGVPGLSAGSLALSRAICDQDRRAVGVSLTLPLGAPAKLELFDVTGRLRASRALDGLGAGNHEVRLKVGGALPAGVYFLRLAQGDETVSRRITAR